MLTIRMIPHFGIYFDEALFAPALYQPDTRLIHVQIFGFTLPLMVMSYVGALKLYLWKLIFAIASPSVWSVRFPMLMVAVLCAGTWGQTLTKLGAQRASGVCTGLMLTSASFLMCSTFDWGPVALQMLLGAWAVNLLSRDKLPLLAGILIGLALWDKLTFAFAYGPLLAVLAMRRPRWQVAVGMLIGGSPLLYALTKASPAQSLVFHITPELLWGRLALMTSTMTGSGLMGFMAVGKPVPDFPALVLLALIAAVAVKGPWRNTRVAFAVSIVLSWCAMAMFQNIGMSVHHTVLLTPILCALIALTIEDAGPRPWEAALLPLVALNLYSLYELGRATPRPLWSPVLNDIATRIAPRAPQRIVCDDWGLQNTIWLMSEGKLRPTTITVTDTLSAADRKSVTTALTTPGTMFITFTEPNRVFPKGHQAIQKLAQELGLPIATVERIRGTVEFDSFFAPSRR